MKWISEKQVKAFMTTIENAPHTYYIADVIKPYIETAPPSLVTLYRLLDSDNRAHILPALHCVIADGNENESLRTLIQYMIRRFCY